MSDRQPNTTIRVNREHGYYAMPRDPAMDNRLSNKALGLLCRILSYPEDWQLSVAGLVKIIPDGKAAVNSGLQELEALGYLERRRIRDDKGVFVCMEYIVYEHPRQTEAEPLPENRTVDTAEGCANPQTDFPAVENPALENPQESKNIINNNPPTPQGGPVDEETKQRNTERTLAFNAFWAAYPPCSRKRDKQKALRAWKREVKPSDREALMQGLEWDKQSRQWLKDGGEYIPAPAVWLNNRRWESAKPPATATLYPATDAAAPDYGAREDWL